MHCLTGSTVTFIQMGCLWAGLVFFSHLKAKDHGRISITRVYMQHGGSELCHERLESSSEGDEVIISTFQENERCCVTEALCDVTDKTTPRKMADLCCQKPETWLLAPLLVANNFAARNLHQKHFRNDPRVSPTCRQRLHLPPDQRQMVMVTNKLSVNLSALWVGATGASYVMFEEQLLLLPVLSSKGHTARTVRKAVTL